MPHPISPRGEVVRLGPGDITVTPDLRGFIIGQLPSDGRPWVALDTVASWPAAVRKAELYSRLRHVRALVSRTGEAFRVLDPVRLWLENGRHWRPYDAVAVEKYVPAAPGVYVLRSVTPVFIGDTDDLRGRLRYHLRESWPCEEARDGPLEFSFDVVDSDVLRAALSVDLIDWWRPPCNQPT